MDGKELGEVAALLSAKARREGIATAVLAGFAGNNPTRAWDLCPAEAAVKWADALMAELDKEG